ncbi:MAG: hypothetical protein N2483_09560, partial [Burkholderiaceae bacterium]|nr:hypothetical protein [Burkholderiaceae bacterium]
RHTAREGTRLERGESARSRKRRAGRIEMSLAVSGDSLRDRLTATIQLTNRGATKVLVLAPGGRVVAPRGIDETGDVRWDSYEAEFRENAAPGVEVTQPRAGPPPLEITLPSAAQ